MGAAKAALAKIYVLAATMGGPGLFVIAVGDSSFVSVPEGNDILIIALSIGQSWARMSYLVLMTIAGSVVGCTLLYTVGRKGGAFVQRISRDRLWRAQAMYSRYGMWPIIVACMLPPPMPFKIFVLSAGIFRLQFKNFLLAVLLGRSLRYFTWGVLAVLYGQSVKDYVEQNLTRVGTILSILLLVLVAGYLLFRKRSRHPLLGGEKL